MSFKRWFKWWLRSFSAVMFFGQKKHKSEWQRTIGSDFLYFVVEILKEQKARKPLINKEKPST